MLVNESYLVWYYEDKKEISPVMPYDSKNARAAFQRLSARRLAKQHSRSQGDLGRSLRIDFHELWVDIAHGMYLTLMYAYQEDSKF